MADPARLDHPPLVDPRRRDVQAQGRARLRRDAAGAEPKQAASRLALRRAGPRDAALVAALGIATYREHFAGFWTPAGLERFLAREFDPATLAAELAGDDVRYELASAGGTPIGYAKTLRARDVPTRTATRGRELRKLYFRAGATGAGHGGALLEHVVAIARADAEPRIWLQVLEANEGAARFYERHGFAAVGRFEFAADRGPAAMRVMVRELAQSRS